MDAEATDNMEMEERGREQEAAEEGEEETNVDDDQHRDGSMLVIDGSNLIFTRPDDATDTSERPEGSVPNAKRDAAIMKRSMIFDKKQFLKEGLGITVNKRDGPSSSLLYDNFEIVRNKKTGNISGVKYRGKKVLTLRSDGKMEYSEFTGTKPYAEEFK